MPTDTQSPAFDAVAEYRKNYEDPRSDEDIAIKLKDPTNFRKAFPDYDYGAPDADKKIAQHMSEYYSQKFAAPRNAQKTDFEKQNEQPEGFLARGLKGLTAKLPGNYSEVPEGAGLTGISTAAGEVADAAKNKARQTEVAQLKDATLGVEPSAGSKLKHLGLNTVGSAAGMVSAATSPSSQAVGLGLIATPEVVGPALIAHGLGTAAVHAPGAIKGNPDEAEASLGGLSEAAGGGAAAVHGFTGGSGLQRIGKATAPARISLAQKAVSPLVYENLGETGADARMNINPERGLTKEGIVGGSKESLFKQAEARTAELKQSANNILQNHQNAHVQIDAGPLIDQAIDGAIKSTEKVAGSTERLESLRTALKTKYGAIKGTPFEMNNLKSEIQEAARGVGAYKNTQPVEASVAAAMGDVASKIRNEVNGHVPEAAALNQRMADLIDAQAGLRKNINGDRGRSSFGGFHEGMAARMANNTLGSAPMRSGLARILMAGETEGVPKPMTLQRAVPRGLLGQGATAMGMGADTSGPVPVSERQPPMVWTPEMRARVAREMPKAPPRAGGEVTSIGSAQNPSAIGARGQAGVRTPIRGLLPERVPTGPVRGPQMDLNLPPEEAPLFNFQTPSPSGRPQHIDGMHAAPQGLEAEPGLTPTNGNGLKRIGVKPVNGYKASEKAETMSGERRDLGPEFDAQQLAHEIERNKSILRNPQATPEDRRIAQSRLDEMSNPSVVTQDAKSSPWAAQRNARDRAARIRQARQ